MTIGRAGREQPDDLIAVSFWVLLAATVVEEQVERRLRRHQLVPVALEDANVLVLGEELGRGARKRLVQLDGHERNRRRERGDDPGGSHAAAGAELADARAPSLGGEQVQQAAHLRDRRVREAEPALQLERACDEGRLLHVRRLGRVLPVPPHFDPETVGEVWRVPVRGARTRGRGMGARARAAAGGRGRGAHLPRRRGRPEHVLHSRASSCSSAGAREPARSTTTAGCASSSIATST